MRHEEDTPRALPELLHLAGVDEDAARFGEPGRDREVIHGAVHEEETAPRVEGQGSAVREGALEDEHVGRRRLSVDDLCHLFHRMMGLDDVEEPEDQQRDRARDADQRGERGRPPATSPADGRQPPAHEQDPPQALQQDAELPGLERQGNLLVAQDAVVRVQLGQPVQHLPGGRPGADPEGGETDRGASDQSDGEPATDVSPTGPRGADEHRERRERRERVVLVLETREREHAHHEDQPEHDDRTPVRGGRAARLRPRQAFDQIKLGSAEPFLLPWIGEWVGPMKLLAFLAQLENSRDHAHAKLAGMRITVSPASFMELGASRAVMFDGCCPYLPLSKYPAVIFNPSFGNDPNHPEERTDNLFSIDGELRFRNLDRYFFPSRDLRLYGEFYWDDTCGGCGPSSGVGHFLASNFLPKGSTVGGVGGVHLLGLFGQDWLDARFEYAQTSRLSYNHSQFTNGYWTRGHVISDFIGTDGRDLFARTTARVFPNLMLGFDIDRAIIGSTALNFPGPQEKRFGGGMDLSYRFWDRYALFAQYLVSSVKNRGFQSGADGFDHLVRIELTRSFR